MIPYQEAAGSAICMKDPVEFFKYGCFSLVGKTCLHLLHTDSMHSALDYKNLKPKYYCFTVQGFYLCLYADF